MGGVVSELVFVEDDMETEEEAGDGVRWRKLSPVGGFFSFVEEASLPLLWRLSPLKLPLFNCLSS